MTPEEIAAQVAAKWYAQPFGLLADPKRALALFIENAIRAALAEAAAPELLAALQQVEWVEDHKEKGLFYCPRCGGEMGMGHYDSCQLGQALARARAD